MGREEIDTDITAHAKQTRWAVGNFGSRLSHLFFVSVFMSSFSFLFSCNEVHEHTAKAILPEDSVSMMNSYGVKILISDSGVIKYRVITERWEVNTVRQPPRWEFMKGVFFEQFDEKFQVQAMFRLIPPGTTISRTCGSCEAECMCVIPTDSSIPVRNCFGTGAVMSSIPMCSVAWLPPSAPFKAPASGATRR